MKNKTRYLYKSLSILLLLIVCSGHVNAVPEANITPILDFFGRTVNILVSVSGTVFSIMILWSASKFAMAQGDPKAVMAAKHTLTMAVVGLIVVVGFYTIMLIIGNALGITSLTNPTGDLTSGVAGFINAINACNEGQGACFGF